MADAGIENHAAFIWSLAELLRGDYKRSEYGKVILPLTVLRRLDCVLEPTKAAVLNRQEHLQGRFDNLDEPLKAAAGQRFYNTSPLDFRRLLADAPNLAMHLRRYIAGFSPGAREVIDRFGFDAHIARLAKADLLYQIVARFADIDLHPDRVSNLEMGAIYEELIRRFAEASNETAGEHFTPREVIRLMVNLLFAPDEAALTQGAPIRTLLDPACGTGGMLTVAADYLRALNPAARLEVYGQEVNDETYAICRSDMMMTGQDPSHISPGNSFTEDGHAGQRFDYLLANPPFGVEWRKVERAVRDEAAAEGFDGRFGAGLPRINDGSLLFLQHMISKMKAPSEGGSRLAIVFNGSPLFSGGAGSGEAEIRRWIIENDWLEAVVALPDQLFYNTGISTYFWVLTNRKAPERRGRVALIDARESWVKMRKSLGNKRKELGEDQITELSHLYAADVPGERVKILPNAALGFQRITVERPLRLRYEVSGQTLATVERSPAWAKLTGEERRALTLGLLDLIGVSTTERPAMAAKLGFVPPPLRKVTWDAISLRAPDAPVVADSRGHPEPDPELRDNESVPLPDGPVSWEEDPAERLASPAYRAAVEEYMTAEVLPYVADAWVDHAKTRIGYEIPLTQYFYKYVPPRPLSEIDAEIRALESEIQELLREVTE